MKLIIQESVTNNLTVENVIFKVTIPDFDIGINVVRKSLVEGKGELIVGSASAQVDNLAVGTDGKFLKANSSEALGVEWADIPGAGIYGEFFLGAKSGDPSTTNGCASPTKTELATNKANVWNMDFDKDAVEYAEWIHPMPMDWDGGTIKAQFYWRHPATTTNFGVVWGLQATVFGNDDARDASWGSGQTVIDTGGTTDDLYISDETPSITPAGSPAAGDLIHWRAYRLATDGSDTLAVDAKLEFIRILYTKS